MVHVDPLHSSPQTHEGYGLQFVSGVDPMVPSYGLPVRNPYEAILTPLSTTYNLKQGPVLPSP